MTKITSDHGARHKTIDWHADTKKYVVPKILRQFKRHGVRFYKCEGNRTFFADTYDALLKTILTKPKSRNYKGELIGGFYE